jgi:hypothetical protein
VTCWREDAIPEDDASEPIRAAPGGPWATTTPFADGDDRFANRIGSTGMASVARGHRPRRPLRGFP